ncbi:MULTISPECIES: hypothetical protein [unclassified Acinetobacter]|uniref:hypothetical protein n=1 Tax=unclassified Acinetobacter TaxID=196816 RepID=UPI0015D384C9|nr:MULTISPECIES: hypothetical protein [unclassified Acinetobacter]
MKMLLVKLINLGNELIIMILICNVKEKIQFMIIEFLNHCLKMAESEQKVGENSKVSSTESIEVSVF